MSKILSDSLEKKNLLVYKLQHLYPSAFEEVPGLQCTANLRGFFMEVNKQWEKVLGWSERELMTKPFIDFVHPDDRQTTLTTYNDQIRKGIAAIKFINRYMHKEGHYIKLEWYSSAPDINGFIHAIAHPID